MRKSSRRSHKSVSDCGGVVRRAWTILQNPEHCRISAIETCGSLILVIASNAVSAGSMACVVRYSEQYSGDPIGLPRTLKSPRTLILVSGMSGNKFVTLAEAGEVMISHFDMFKCKPQRGPTLAIVSSAFLVSWALPMRTPSSRYHNCRSKSAW